MPLASSSHPTPVWRVNWRCANRLPLLSVPDRALRELTATDITYGAYSPFGRYGGARPFFARLRSPAPRLFRPCGNGGRIFENIVSSVAHVSLLPTERGSAKRVRAATFSPPTRDDTPVINARDSPPPKLLGLHPAVSCTPSTMGAERFRHLSPPMPTSVAS